MTEFLQIVILAVFGAISLSIWWYVYRQSLLRQPVIAAESRSDVPWRGMHVAMAFVIWLMLQLIGEFAIRWRYSIPPNDPLPLDNVEIKILRVAAFSIVSIISATLIGTYLKIDLKATLRDLGWSGHNIGRDMMTGLIAFLAIVPVVLAINVVLQAIYRTITGEDPSVHPIIKDSQSNPSYQLMIWHAISAVIVAPLVEEFIFRGVLQGWLEKLSRVTRAIEVKRQNRNFATNTTKEPIQEPNQENPYAAGQADDRETVTAMIADSDDSIPEPPMIAPIIVSSLFFSFFHWGHGVAPVPLFFLAIVLGYLYQRTHRLLPSLVVHVGLNGLSMASIWYDS
jgi:membrane protease YdiL (CAAX protease family)